MQKELEFMMERLDLLIDSASRYSDIKGINKLISLANSECKFLKKLIMNPQSVKAAHLTCSNIPFLEAIFKVLQFEHGVVAIFEKFSSDANNHVRVDVVADFGMRWIKIKSCSTKILNNSNFDDELVVDSDVSDEDGFEYTEPENQIYRQAKELQEAAGKNQFHYKNPKLIVRFVSAAEYVGEALLLQGIYQKFRAIDVKIQSQTFDNEKMIRFTKLSPSGHFIPIENPPNLSTPLSHLCSTINMDVTTLIALASNFTNKDVNSWKDFQVSSLQSQFESEKLRPEKKIIESVLKNPQNQWKRIICSKDAFYKFFHIVSGIAGPEETVRSFSLFKPKILQAYNINIPSNYDASFHPFHPYAFEIEIVESSPVPYDSVNEFNASIFGTGNTFKSTTITANSSVASKLSLSYGISVFVHEPRSFVERKIQTIDDLRK